MGREEKGRHMGSYDDVQPGKPPGEEATSLAARRARLRGSLAKAAVPEEAFGAAASALPHHSGDEPEPEAGSDPSPPAPFPSRGSVPDEPTAALLHGGMPAPVSGPGTAPAVVPSPATPLQAAAVPPAILDLLNNIDQAMNACALNLAALQKISGEQTDVLKSLSDTLKNETLFEIGLNLNSLTESLSAALEPMKAVGELVPAIDQLVAAMEARAAVDEKYSPDNLVMNLADQLSNGTIDPWTFKCAYMAIFPGDHPADLLRRLVELLGTQRLPGDLFREAYEAVQGAEPPARGRPSAHAPAPASQQAGSQAPDSAAAAASAAAPSGGVMTDHPETRAELEALRAANEEMRRALEERENEFEQLLAAKDQELQEAQDMLNTRYEEFNTRYAELTEALNKREDEYKALLENKDMELSEKESELSLLRHQMEELRSQTEEMVKDLQKQMADVRIAKEAASASPTLPGKPPSAAGFFDTAPPTRPSSLFDATPEQPHFAEPAAPQNVPPQPQSQPPAPAPVQASPPPVASVAPAPQPVVAPPVPPAVAAPPTPVAQQQTSQAVPRANPAQTTPFGTQEGPYGRGVRAQVFEVIVRQALAGAPWREICAGPMQVNGISPDEVEAEVQRRQQMLNKR